MGHLDAPPPGAEPPRLPPAPVAPWGWRESAYQSSWSAQAAAFLRSHAAGVRPIAIEVAQPDGPFGARGVGEHTMIPAAPIVANAVEDALGVRMKSMPITAEKLALALEGIDYESVKGKTMGLCFMGEADKYKFKTGK